MNGFKASVKSPFSTPQAPSMPSEAREALPRNPTIGAQKSGMKISRTRYQPMKPFPPSDRGTKR